MNVSTRCEDVVLMCRGAKEGVCCTVISKAFRSVLFLAPGFTRHLIVSTFSPLSILIPQADFGSLFFLNVCALSMCTMVSSSSISTPLGGRYPGLEGGLVVSAKIRNSLDTSSLTVVVGSKVICLSSSLAFAFSLILFSVRDRPSFGWFDRVLHFGFSVLINRAAAFAQRLGLSQCLDCRSKRQ